jgi:hypothetical protein
MISCTACRAELPRRGLRATGKAVCRVCGKTLEVHLFPVLFRSDAMGTTSDSVVLDDQTRCFFHDGKPAIRPCDSCGRFLCSLCDLELGERHLCPTCVESGKAKGKLQSLENRRLLWDEVALSMSILPLLLFWLTILTAPAVLFLIVRHWRSPGSILPRTRTRFVIAGLLAVTQIGLWALLIAVMVGS